MLYFIFRRPRFVQIEVLTYYISDNKLLIYAISTDYTKLGHFHKFIHRKYSQILLKHGISNVDDTLAYLLAYLFHGAESFLRS